MPLQRAPARARFSVLLPKLSHQPLRPSDDDSSPPASERFEGASPREELELYVIDAAAVRAELRDATNGASGRLAACDLARRLACRQLAFERARLASALVHAPPPLIEIERDAARARFRLSDLALERPSGPARLEALADDASSADDESVSSFGSSSFCGSRMRASFHERVRL